MVQVGYSSLLEVSAKAIALVLLVATCAFGNGCGRGKSATENSDQLSLASNSWTWAPGVAIGPVRLGMSRSEVQAAIGAPEREMQGAWDYPSAAMSVLFGLADDKVSAILAGSRTAGPGFAERFKGRSAEGIGIGSRRADVVSAFGTPPFSHIQGDWEVFVFASRGLEIALKDSAVGSFSIRGPREIKPRRSP